MRARRAGASAAEIVETHVSVIAFIGDRAYKLKKPVDLGFLDFSTRERREEACRREVELNRRLAPDVYLRVLDVVDDAGRPVDHLVEMRRMPADARLSTLLHRDRDRAARGLRDVARLVAAFHASAPRSAA
ncbi:MAG TPA: hypothetical protein VHN98_07670, partial [Acidimicrobiales bacterium]|nr:hypothetical protein [Acidimicrobiales bacterium]